VTADQRTGDLFQLSEVITRLDDVLLMGLMKFKSKLVHFKPSG